MPSQPAPQNFKNHTKLVPLFHFFTLPVLAINALWAIVHAVRHPALDTAFGALVAVALAMGIVLARLFALTAQDRVIRLEMRLRLRELLPADLAPRIGEFTPGQLVALRFAGDRELPVLARRVLDEHLDDRKAIKQLIADWQADRLRV